MSIPKIIHYCWFGNGKKDELFYKCLESWKKYCPDYEIIEWNENNYKTKFNSYVENAYKEKKWAFVSDYVRLDVIYKYGGIYLDTDVELISSLDKLINLSAYFGVDEHDLKINTGLGFGAEKNNKIIRELRDFYDTISFYKEDGELNLTPCTDYCTNYFEKLGYIKNNKVQEMENIKILSSEYLSPYNYENGEMKCRKNTISIHWYNASWDDEDNKKIHEIELKIMKIFKGKLGKIICFIYRKSYRVIKAVKKRELINLVRKKLKKRNKK